MRCRLLLGGLLVFACRKHEPEVTLYRELVGGEIYMARHARLEPLAGGPNARDAAVEVTGNCRLSREVVVVDAQDHPLAGVAVTVEQTSGEHASEETLAVYRWFTKPLLTDATGKVRVCDPGELVVLPEIQGLGGGFVGRSSGRIEVCLGSRTASVQGPFAGAIRIVLP